MCTLYNSSSDILIPNGKVLFYHDQLYNYLCFEIDYIKPRAYMNNNTCSYDGVQWALLFILL